MRRRWIADEVHGNTAALTGEHAAHLARVLRARVGQQFEISIGSAVRLGTIISINEQRVEFSLGAEQANQPGPQITLVLAIFKFDRMEWAIEKCTEIGVARIIPVIARRTDSHLAAAAGKRQERWQRIALQASEQSRRTAPPEVAGPLKLKELLTAGEGTGGAPGTAEIVLAETGADVSLREALHDQQEPVTLAVGPEGGWTEEELNLFRDAGWIAASLGDTILRAETAAIVASAIALDVLRF